MERDSPRAELIEAITDAERFVSATWSGARSGSTPAAERVTLRPVDLKVGRVLWTIDMPSAHAPAAGEGLVFVPAGDRLSAVDVHGTLRWSLPVNGGRPIGWPEWTTLPWPRAWNTVRY